MQIEPADGDESITVNISVRGKPACVSSASDLILEVCNGGSSDAATSGGGKAEVMLNDKSHAVSLTEADVDEGELAALVADFTVLSYELLDDRIVLEGDSDEVKAAKAKVSHFLLRTSRQKRDVGTAGFKGGKHDPRRKHQ